MQYTLSNDNFEVIVDSKGCEIVSVIRKSDNKQYIWSWTARRMEKTYTSIIPAGWKV